MTENKDPVEAVIEQAKPLLANLSFGAIMGYCSGLAMKKVGKAMAVAIGTVFVGLQTAVSFGYLEVDWEKVKVDVVKKVDTTGDGKLDVEDAKAYWRKLKKLLTHRVPSAGGFSVGFLYGVKNG